ncbi:helix-turn-helix domain-containing protein [Hominifimenecus sp. rT4P-3]|uniref:helix-turn-helix transcriptional regulator n=1 Tax=Hominifimenecus sp. rT4P-3 TaxID=3242979 RepID=UPI003DA48024
MWIYDYKSEKDNPYKEPPFFEIIHMSYVDNLPAWSYPWHAHEDSYELAFVMQGSGMIYVNTLTLPVETGSIILIPKNLMHHFSASGDETMQYYTLRFRTNPGDPTSLSSLFRPDCAVTSGINYLPFMKSTFQLLFHLHQTNGGIVDKPFQSICLGLFHLAQELLTNEAMTVRLDEHFSASDILNYISEHSSEKITLESLAQHFHVSPSHLSRIFCNAYHISPINYIIYSRITLSTEYLLKSDLSVSEISELVGYENPTHFTNLFIKRIGCTPSEYRKRNQQIP